MYSRYLILPAVLLLSLFSIAQTGSIEGAIMDANSRTPVVGASVNLPGNKGDNSDLFGKFSITGIYPGQYELVVSHVGYRTEIIPVEVKKELRSSVSIHLKKEELNLEAVTVNSKKYSSLQSISSVDIQLRPVNTSQDVLRIVPGLFIAQHAGGGKAEQIFLRGFDIDHGTDIAVTVDGIPVNMVSHAHGQGYADLHFLIPETVEKVSFDKGPYYAAKGNLATAAYVDFSTRQFLEENLIKTEIGQFNTRRMATMLKLFNKTTEKKRQQFYIASEYSTTDGYFDSPQDFHRFNLMGKYNAWFGNQAQLTITASTFDSKWNASGQIPERAVKSGMISRFGAIDDTEGGNTSRTNLSVQFNKQWRSNWKTTDQLYFSHYKFNLFSNFTFFLDDPVNGDMIQQKEKRDIYGYTTTATRSWMIGNRKTTTTFGGGFRYDKVRDISLSKANRTTFFNPVQQGDINELNSSIYINQDLELTDKVNLNAGIRYDHFIFGYRDALQDATGFSTTRKGILSPKLNISYSPHPKLKLYLNNGFGFHSNDTRVILNNNADKVLPRVFGTDLGIILKPGKSLVLKTALWHLLSEQEFVYVGDAGVVEPSGRTRRMGIDVSVRYQFNRWLFADLDVNLTRAKAIGTAKGEDYIPLAPLCTSIGGITAKSKNGFSGYIRYRFIGDRPANETNTVRAQGYLLADALLSYRLKQFELSLSAENLMNSNWREAQFDTESRLKNELNPVSEIHYTPGTPRNIKAGLSFHF